MLSKQKTEYFKGKLEKRKKDLEEALSHVGQKNPKIAGDWELTMADMNVMTADKNELADAFEQLENRAAIEDKLESQLTFINEALEKIKNGKFGICETGGEQIEEDRLEANPSAKNCIKHAKKK
ncbi:MAG: TraR/DksA C4-type zinc finger protein [Candidatus Paceibacterota bacterium]